MPLPWELLLIFGDVVKNILVITIDDMGREQSSIYPGLANPANIATMNNVNGLWLGGGVRMDRFYVTPLCSPTRAAFITGRYSFRQGTGDLIDTNDSAPLKPSEPTLPMVLSAVGMRTALFGKWHLGNATNGGNASPLLAGRYGHHSGTMRNFSALAGESYYRWPWIVNGEDRGYNLEYATSRTANDAIRWIRRAGTEPWFAHVCFNSPHAPFSGPPIGTYDSVRWGVVNPAGPPDDMPATINPFYKAMLENIDYEIGRILTGIPTAILSNTLIFIFSDNGSADNPLSNEVHPTKGAYQANGAQGKQTVFEPGIRVPCIIAGAGVAVPGRASSELVHIVDLWRTIIAQVGITPTQLSRILPSGRIVDGLDRSFILDNVAGPSRLSIFSELFAPNGPNEGTTLGRRAMVGPRYKLRINNAAVTTQAAWSFYDLDHLDANNQFETNAAANLTPGGSLAGLSDSDPAHPGELTAFNSLMSSMLALLATYDEDEIL